MTTLTTRNPVQYSFCSQYLLRKFRGSVPLLRSAEGGRYRDLNTGSTTKTS